MEEPNYRTQILEELVTKQLESLEIAEELLAMKSRLVELCEQETEIYKRELSLCEQKNKRLRKFLRIAFGWIVFRTIIDIISLLY
jgi:ABC-type uncharacterized transport system involved in gliding motility auxiliary subunit